MKCNFILSSLIIIFCSNASDWKFLQFTDSKELLFYDKNSISYDSSMKEFKVWFKTISSTLDTTSDQNVIKKVNNQIVKDSLLNKSNCQNAWRTICFTDSKSLTIKKIKQLYPKDIFKTNISNKVDTIRIGEHWGKE